MSVHFKKVPHPSSSSHHRLHHHQHSINKGSWFGFLGKFLSYVLLTIIGVRMSFTFVGEYDLEGFMSKISGQTTCEDRDSNCPSFLSQPGGGCDNRPEWMLVNCAKSCKSCHLTDPFIRCTRKILKISETPAYKPGN
jgi:hypothetical protein